MPDAFITIAWKPLVERAEALVVVVRRLHLLEVLGERGELVVGEPRRGGPRHLPLEHAADGDQVVEQRHVVVVLERDPEHDGVEQVPGVARLNGRAATLLDADEATLLEELQRPRG